jgi:hypothetical protein
MSMQNMFKPRIWSEIWDDQLSFLKTGTGLLEEHPQKNVIVIFIFAPCILESLIIYHQQMH